MRESALLNKFSSKNIMFPIELFLTDYGLSAASMNVFEFAKRYKEQLLQVLRIDSFNRGNRSGQILGDHIFYLVFLDSKRLCKLLVLGCGATSGYSGSGPADFKMLMDWISMNEIDIDYYSAHSYEEYFQLWGSELNQHGQNVPSQRGLHRNHGPSPWDYGDGFVQQSSSLSSEEYHSLSRGLRSTQQQVYSNTLEFLLGRLDLGKLLKFW